MAVVVRAVAAAAVGAAVVLVWWGVFWVFPDLPAALGGECGPGAEPLCDLGAALTGVIGTIALVVGASIAMGWGGLWLARVRPAGPVALLAPVLTFVLVWLVGPAVREAIGAGALAQFAVLVGAGYGLAALVTARWRA